MLVHNSTQKKTQTSSCLRATEQIGGQLNQEAYTAVRMQKPRRVPRALLLPQKVTHSVTFLREVGHRLLRFSGDRKGCDRCNFRAAA